MKYSIRGSKVSGSMTGVAAALFAFAAAAASAATINVVPGPANAIATAVASAGSGDEVVVADGTYTETGSIILNTANVILRAENDGAAIINFQPTQSSNTTVAVKIRNNNVTVQGLVINLDASEAGVGISAFSGDVNTGVTNLNNLVIKNNSIQITGTNVGFTGAQSAGTVACPIPFKPGTLKSAATTTQPGHTVGININRASGTIAPTATISGNTIGSATVPFGIGIHFERSSGTIGGNTPADGNTIYAEDQDLNVRFASGTYPYTVTVKNNTFNGWGDERNRTTQVEIGDCGAGAVINVENNTFNSPSTNPSPRLGKTQRGNLGFKNGYGSDRFYVRNNTFNVRTIGIWSHNYLGWTAENNTFNIQANNAVAIALSNKCKTGSGTASSGNASYFRTDTLWNRMILWGNTFNSGGFSGASAVEFWNHESVNANGGGTPGQVSQVVLGGPGAKANTFNSGFANFIKLDNASGTTNADPRYSPGTNNPTASPANFANSTMSPYSLNVIAWNNKFDVSGTAKLPEEMTSGEKTTLQGFIQDKNDVGALGLVLLDPTGTDTDQDGIPDAIETALGTNVNSKDSDADGIEDLTEVFIGKDPVVAGAYTDTDKDGLPFGYDRVATFDASGDNAIDQDNDGFSDGYERVNGSDPFSASSVPVVGDVNGNSVTDNNDASVIFNYYLGNIAAPTYLNRADINRSGAVDYVDAVILFNWSLAPTRRVAVIPSK